jgi:hypothetical protein
MKEEVLIAALKALRHPKAVLVVCRKGQLCDQFFVRWLA